SSCKYFDVIEEQWKDVPVKEREPGKSITCSTPHLTDFAAFEAIEGQPQQEWDKNLLWLLMLLLVVPVGGVLIVGIVLLTRKVRKEMEIRRKKQEIDAALDEELQNV